MGDISYPLEQPKMDRQALVVRHNHLIESRHRLSLVERRFMLWIVSQIGKDDEELKSYSISVKEWIKFCALSGRKDIYKDIQNMSRSLVERSVDIVQEDGSFHLFPWFYDIIYHAGEGMLTVRMHPKLKPYLLQLKSHYTALTLEYALLLQSTYSGRIYDLLKQYESVGERVISIDGLRSMLKLEDRYPKFADFRIWVIEASQKEVNAKTDISFSWKAIKKGRKYNKIHFKIWSEIPKVNLENREESEPRAKHLFRCLCKRGIAESVARNLVNDYDDDRIKWHVSEYDKLIVNKKIQGSGWLIKGIESDYRPAVTKDLFDDEELKNRRKEYEKQKADKEKQEKIEKDKLAYEKYYANHISESRDKLSQKAKKMIDEAFLKTWEATTDDGFGVARNFREKGLSSRYTALRYGETLIVFYPDLHIDLNEWNKKHSNHE